MTYLHGVTPAIAGFSCRWRRYGQRSYVAVSRGCQQAFVVLGAWGRNCAGAQVRSGAWVPACRLGAGLLAQDELDMDMQDPQRPSRGLGDDLPRRAGKTGC
ncbi:MAG TPA: hypothetical protein VNW50_11320 [Streptosporangiaceae bacterium]|nr:hypothetical protein [Streptosporangiaceae bacterium]